MPRKLFKEMTRFKSRTHALREVKRISGKSTDVPEGGVYSEAEVWLANQLTQLEKPRENKQLSNNMNRFYNTMVGIAKSLNLWPVPQEMADWIAVRNVFLGVKEQEIPPLGKVEMGSGFYNHVFKVKGGNNDPRYWDTE